MVHSFRLLYLNMVINVKIKKGRRIYPIMTATVRNKDGVALNDKI